MNRFICIFLLVGSCLAQEPDFSKLDDDSFEVREAETTLISEPKEGVDKAKYVISLIELSRHYRYTSPEVSIRLFKAARNCFNKHLLFKDSKFAKLFGYCGLITCWFTGTHTGDTSGGFVEYVHTELENKISRGDFIIGISSDHEQLSKLEFHDWQYHLNDNFNNIIPGAVVKLKLRRLKDAEDLIYVDPTGERHFKYGHALLDLFNNATKYEEFEVEFTTMRKHLDQVDREEYVKEYDAAWYRFLDSNIPIELPNKSVQDVLIWGLNQIFGIDLQPK